MHAKKQKYHLGITIYSFFPYLCSKFLTKGSKNGMVS